MPNYFYVLDASVFQQRIVPALSASWQQRSFDPCRSLCEMLAPRARAFTEQYCSEWPEPFLCQVPRGAPFDRNLWRHLAGEVLLHAAEDLPDLQLSQETLFCLLAPEHVGQEHVPRERFAPIQQALFGTHDLVFGSGFYYPERVGFNDSTDVVRLADYLESIQFEQWTTAALHAFKELATEEDREEELAFAREWYPALQELYREAAEHARVVVCEILFAM